MSDRDDRFGLLIAVAENAIKPSHPRAAKIPPIIQPVVLALLTAIEWGALSVARRNNAIPPQ